MTASYTLHHTLRFLHWSMLAVWLGTAAVCFIDEIGSTSSPSIGRLLLLTAGITQPNMQSFLIFSGLLADL